MLVSGCFSSQTEQAKAIPCESAPAENPTFTLSGRIRYGYVPATAVGSSSGKLDYTQISNRVARRVMAQALDNCGRVVVEAPTKDDGTFQLTVPGNTVTLAVAAHLKASSYSGTGNCTGASWDVKVVDNTRSKTLWTYDSALTFSQDAQSINVDIPLTHNGSKYTDRSAAPFALADTVVSAIEKVCQGTHNTVFPPVLVNWSPNNRAVSGDKALGEIVTSHFTVESWEETAFPQLYILGKEGADTDEYDDHVVAHEFGHYLENSIYRSDTIGGSHSGGDMLDPRVAFGEGYGNAFSGMTFNNPVYVDTYGALQGGGFQIKVQSAPGNQGINNQGIHSEGSAQYLLWKLFENSDGNASNNLGSYSKIDNVLRNYQRTTPALTSLLSFSAYYNSVYGGSSESLQTLWSSDLLLPYDALCKGGASSGACSGAGAQADPFDEDGDIGTSLAASLRVYDGARDAAFWNPYLKLNPGANSATGHDVIDRGPNGGTSYLYNKLGYVRWYRYTHDVGSASGVRVDLALGGGKSCSTDYADLVVYHKGQIVASDWGFGGCPSVQWLAQPGEDYVLTVEGAQLGTSGNPNFGEVSSFSLTVAR